MKKLMVINRVIFLLSICGIAMAIYVLQSFLRQSPIVCVSNGCELVRKSPYSYPFGIPVPAFGLIGYSLLAIASFLRSVKNDKRLLYVMLGVSIFGALFVSWFTLTELFLIKGICMWCGISAVNMIIIGALVMYTVYRSQYANK